jgi:hypothetical protein
VQLLLGRYAEGYAALVFNLDRQDYLDFPHVSFIFLLPGFFITLGGSSGGSVTFWCGSGSGDPYL